MLKVLDRAGPSRHSLFAPSRVAFHPHYGVGAPEIISRLDTRPIRTPVNASQPPYGGSAHDSGPSWLATPSMFGSFIRYSTPVYPGAQWVLMLPKRLRFVVAWRPKLISLALRLFLRALFSWQRRHARRRGIENPLCGAITFIQRFGSALNLNLHYHTLVPDGVFAEDAAGEVQFHPLAPPTLSDLEKLLRKLVPRLLRALASDSDLADPSDWMQVLAQWLQTGAGSPSGDPPKGLCVLAEGFSLHAGVAVDAFDRDALERLARYCARPPLALRRLSLTQDGQILYRTKHAAPGAPRLLRFSPTQFLGRLAALVPPPRSHLLRFHGVFAPHSSYRDRVVPVPPPSPEPAEPNIQTSSQATATNDPVGTCTSDVPALRPLWLPPLLPKVRSMRPDSRLDWATLLRRTFGIDVLHCDRCGGRRRLMALVSDEKIAQKILAHLGLPTQAPASSPVRAPPQAAEFPGCNDQDGIDPIPLSWQS